MIRERLEIIIDPMFAGKSTELIRRVNRYTPHSVFTWPSDHIHGLAAS